MDHVAFPPAMDKVSSCVLPSIGCCWGASRPVGITVGPQYSVICSLLTTCLLYTCLPYLYVFLGKVSPQTFLTILKSELCPALFFRSLKSRGSLCTFGELVSCLQFVFSMSCLSQHSSLLISFMDHAMYI